MTQCTRKKILENIKTIIEGNCDYYQDDQDKFVYYLEGGILDILDLLSICTTARYNLLSEIMLRLDNKNISREEMIVVIADLMLGFNK